MPRHSRRWCAAVIAVLPALASSGATSPPPAADFLPTLADFAGPASLSALERRIARDVGEVSSTELRHTLAELTAQPHLAGTPRSREVAAWIAGRFRAAGLAAAVDGYRALLSYPRELHLELIAPQAVAFDLAEPPTDLDPQIGHGAFPPFSAYSASGDVTAELVYAGSGRPADYRELDGHGISVAGRIVLLRYGGLFRGTKVRIAQEQGAAGVILFTDPAYDGSAAGSVFPAGPWRPDWSVQVGSVWGGSFSGDPATPGFPSPPAAEATPFSSDALPLTATSSPPPRPAAETARDLPRIPVLPISAANAARLLALLDGPVAPEPWRGALPLTYRLGPGPARVRLHVEMETTPRDIWNAIGWLPGETDELLIAGAHHDAWNFGAVDSGSGVVATIEAARVMGAAVRAGWRPRRTVMFAAWDGEEYSLIGSTEFAERHAAVLARRTVAIINLDGAVGGAGGAISALGAPQLAAWLELAAERVPYPLEPGTLLAAWLRQEGPKPVSERPSFPFLGAVSDHAAFAVALGIPAAGFGIGEEFGGYHSTLDNFRWVAGLGDPSFLWHRVLTQWLVAALEIGADAERIPLAIADYGARLERDLSSYAETVAAIGEPRLVLELESARDLARAWHAAAVRFDARGRDASQSADAAAMSRWNELARTVDRRFLVPEGLQGQPGPRHLLVAPGERTGAGRALLPTLDEDLRRGDSSGARAKLVLLAAQLRAQITALSRF